MRVSVPISCGSAGDRKSTRLNSSHLGISYAVFCLKKKNKVLFGFDIGLCSGQHSVGADLLRLLLSLISAECFAHEFSHVAVFLLFFFFFLLEGPPRNPPFPPPRPSPT